MEWHQLAVRGQHRVHGEKVLTDATRLDVTQLRHGRRLPFTPLSLALSPEGRGKLLRCARMGESVDVAIVGAGQAGLATSWYLTQANVDHVILEAGRVAETWRSRRWDSFCLVTHNWTVQLPGAKYAGPDPDGFMDLAALVRHFQGWADSFDAPVTEGCAVTALDADGDHFVLTMANGQQQSRTVVVASGGYQRTQLPANAGQLPTNL